MLNTTLKSAVKALEKQTWLDALADQVQKAVQAAYKDAGAPGMATKDFLHGVWLGHPLHPVLVSIPIGAWTSALILDSVEMLTGDDALAPGADALVAIGLTAAVGAAATGVTDWSETHDAPRRVGLVHALLNVGATVMYLISLADRISGHRRAARGSALLGMALATASAYLGGELAYEEQIGVDHTQGQNVPHTFSAVLPASELGEGQMTRVNLGDTRILLARQNKQLYALCEVCAHQGGPLSEGTLEDGAVVCPWHGSRFALEDGHVLNGPSTYPQPSYEVRVRKGQIEVRNKE